MSVSRKNCSIRFRRSSEWNITRPLSLSSITANPNPGGKTGLMREIIGKASAATERSSPGELFCMASTA